MKIREITDKERSDLLALKHEDIDLKLLKDLFAFTAKAPRKFNPGDTMILKKNEYYNNKQEYTTVGRYIFNKLVLGPTLIPHIGYINKPLDEGGIEDLDIELSELLMSETIEVKDYIAYIDRINWLGYSINNFMTASLNSDLYIEPERVVERKNKLFEKHQEELDKGNAAVMEQIEKELLDLSREETKDNPAMEIFDSGARGSYGNNYKNSVVVRGAIMNPVDNTFDISKASLVEGIPKEDYHIYANLIVNASYSRAKNTEEGGHIGKKLHYAFQHMKLDEPGSDCGTKKTLTMKLDKSNIKLFQYRYIVDKGELILLDRENLEKYMGKTVELRSPLYCLSDDFCNKCAGDLYYNIGIRNVGLLTNRKGTSLMVASMKLFHNTTVRMTKVNIDDYIREVK